MRRAREASSRTRRSGPWAGAALLLTSCTASASSPASSLAHPPHPTTRAHAAPLSVQASAEWPQPGNNLWGDRYSADTLLDASDIARLVPAYSAVLPHFRVGGEEAEPIERDGALYVTTSGDHLLVFDAATGTPLWRADPTLTQVPGWSPESNRGAAAGPSGAFLLTADDRLLAFDGGGRVRFAVQVADPAAGYSEQMAPLVVGSSVIVGSAGGDEGTRGFVAAFSATDGHPLWRWWSVPPPGTGWNQPASGGHGGGDVWTTPVADPASGTIFAGTGNPSPNFAGGARPGADPYTDSVVALDAAPGRLRWATQEVAHDLWDSDAASPPVLFPRLGRLAVGAAGKDGEWYELDAKTGAPLISPVDFVTVKRSPPTPAGVEEWPGTEGGANYGPSAFDPRTGDAYVAGIELPTIVRTAPGTAPSANPAGDQEDAGTSSAVPAGVPATGTLSAIDAVSGRMVWHRTLPAPPIGGVTVTAGGLCLVALEDGSVLALDAKSGTTLWSAHTGGPIGMAPIVYDTGGSAYVVVATGGAESLKYQFPSNAPYELVAWRLPGHVSGTGG